MPKTALRWWPLRARRRLLAIGALASISVAAAGWASAGPIGKDLAPCRVWTVVPTPVLEGAYLEAVDATATEDVWAVGEYGGTYGIVDHWDGSSWTMTTQQGISNSLSAVAAVLPSDVWASGYKLNRDGVTKAFAEHWDGISWTPMSTPRPGYDSRLLALAAFSASDVWERATTSKPTCFIPCTYIGMGRAGPRCPRHPAAEQSCTRLRRSLLTMCGR